MNRLSIVALSTALTLPLFQAAPTQAEPITTPSDNSVDLVAQFVTSQFTPSTSGVPSGTQGGGTRGAGCPTDSANHGVSLVPLTAGSEQNLTVSERPTILAHMTNKSVNQLFLSIKNEQGDHVYQTFLSIPEESGILSLSLPDDAPALEVGSTYQWSFAIVCGNNLRPDDPVVRLNIERVELDAIASENTLEQISWYAENSLWYDTIATLAEARQANPNNAEMLSIWGTSLDAIDLADLASAPLLF